MLFKLLVVLFLIVIIYSLGSGLYFLVRDKNDSDRVVKALTWRIGLSLLLFVLLFIAYALGWISPHTI
jgi:putative copper export protein